MNRNELIVMQSYFGYKPEIKEYKIRQLIRYGLGVYYLDPQSDFCEIISNGKSVFMITNSFLKWTKGIVPIIGTEFLIDNIKTRMIGHLTDQFIVQNLITNEISSLGIEAYINSKT